MSFGAATLLDGLAAIAAAGSRLDVAAGVCAVLADLPGVRGAAVLQRHGGAAIVLGSAGYACDTMSPASTLPLDSGLPAATAIRTGRLVLQGDGPSWCAMPFGRRTTDRGALLLSLNCAPPAGESDIARLQRLVTALGAGLDRAARTDVVSEDLSSVLAGLAPPSALPESETAVRQTARGGALGGDVALCLVEGGHRWLFMADVSGAGLAAAGRAAAVRVALRALTPVATGPAHLLQLLDRALRPETPEGGFVTAVAVHLEDRSLRVASAGHPAPFLLTGGEAAHLPVEPGPPLALESTDVLPPPVELVTTVPAQALVVLYSDGLVDRRTVDGTELDIRTLLAAVTGLAAPADVADALLGAAEAVGPADDDTAVLVSRV